MLGADGWRIYTLLTENPKWIETVTEALDVEKKGREKAAGKDYDYYGWEWYAVHTPAHVLNKMVAAKVLDITMSSRSSTSYMVRDGELLREVIETINTEAQEPTEEQTEIPGDLFDLVVGHDNIKHIVRYAIEAKSPCHCLLNGPPASAKTLFLMELSRLPRSAYVLAPTLSAAGLAELLFVAQPDFLLIDEIDRLSGSNLGVLNSLMATGRVAETKYRKTREMDLCTKVFAAAIKIRSLPSDLLSRFVTLKFDPYMEQEFIRVSTTVLQTLESLSPESADAISQAVWGLDEAMSDVRQCIQIARMSDGEIVKIKEIVGAMSQSAHLRRPTEHGKDR